MTQIIYVGIAEYKVITGTGILACSALGSCVAVCLWDYETRVTGLVHALLPTSRESIVRSSPAKFVDQGINLLVKEMESCGASIDRIMAKIVGGACLYRYEQSCAASETGAHNIATAKEALKNLGIPIIAQHVGGEYGRSIKVYPEDFAVYINVLSKGVLSI